MKTHTCKNCKEEKLWVDNKGLCVQCEEEFCQDCGQLCTQGKCACENKTVKELENG